MILSISIFEGTEKTYLLLSRGSSVEALIVIGWDYNYIYLILLYCMSYLDWLLY